MCKGAQRKVAETTYQKSFFGRPHSHQVRQHARKSLATWLANRVAENSPHEIVVRLPDVRESHPSAHSHPNFVISSHLYEKAQHV